MNLEKFENRVPPPVVTLVAALLMWLFALLLPQASAAKASPWFALTMAIFGIGFLVAAVVRFVQQKTTVNPLQPEQASTLVTDGIYQVTRNPMYAGMLLLLLAWAVLLGNILSMVCLAPWLFWMNSLQIAPEERAMKRLFAEQYDDYCSKVRRWF